MAPRKPTADEINAAKMIKDAFPGTEFVTVYEGIGTTWDFKLHPVFAGEYMRHERTEMLKYGSKTETEMRDVYTFKGPDGEIYAIWGSFSLVRGLSDAKPGDVYRLTYNGKNAIEGTDKEVKDFKVEKAVTK